MNTSFKATKENLLKLVEDANNISTDTPLIFVEVTEAGPLKNSAEKE